MNASAWYRFYGIVALLYAGAICYMAQLPQVDNRLEIAFELGSSIIAILGFMLLLRAELRDHRNGTSN